MRRWILAAGAALALALPSSLASAATQTIATPPESSLASRLGGVAGSLYDTAQSHLIAPSRRAAGELLAYLRTEAIYRRLSQAAQSLLARADADVFQPIARGTAEIVARLEHTGGSATAAPPSPSVAAAPHLAPPQAAPSRLASGAAEPVPPPALGIPGLTEGDILRHLHGDDPLEPFNRLMFRLNGGLQAKVLGPASMFYLDHTSAGVQLGVGNFFRNLREPATFVSSALEGQFDDAGAAAARFGINTTLGIGGIRDPATAMGYTVRPRNLEETLCTYDLPTGPYLVLPILGPSSLRDAVGRLATVAMYFEVMGPSVYLPYRISDFAVQYAMVKAKIDLMDRLSRDPYAAQRALYLAMRELSCGRQATIHHEFFAR